jgi:hypothetical protein
MLSPIYLPVTNAPTQSTELPEAPPLIPPVTATPGHVDDWVTLSSNGNRSDRDNSA